MARTRFNPQRVKIHFSYTVEDIARMLGVHKNTVRAWLKAGLEAIDDRRPVMVQGRVLRAFLERKRTVNRSRCPPGTLYCVKCRAPRPPALGMVDFIPLRPSSGYLRALCETCATLMHLAANRARLGALMPNLEVRITEPDARLMGSGAPSLNCDSRGE
jgi:hypothetical protein